MRIIWTEMAKKDIARLHRFIGGENRKAADKAVASLFAVSETLLRFPNIGELVEGYEPRRVRRWLVKDYEIHYEQTPSEVSVINVWHQREQRLI